MPLKVEILEPGLALSKGRGYVGLTDADDAAELVFPHVDSCLALALLLDNKRLLGGHVVAQWPGMASEDRHFSILQIISLMDANLGLAGGKPVRLVLAGHGNWWHADCGSEVGTAIAHWDDVETYLGVTTDDKAPKGCDIHITNDALEIENLSTHVWSKWPGLRQMTESIYKVQAF